MLFTKGPWPFQVKQKIDSFNYYVWKLNKKKKEKGESKKKYNYVYILKKINK